MCSEFWSGWFDHWGAKHETRSAEELVKGMKEMLDRNISFSLYMTHGGLVSGIGEARISRTFHRLAHRMIMMLLSMNPVR